VASDEWRVASVKAAGQASLGVAAEMKFLSLGTEES